MLYDLSNQFQCEEFKMRVNELCKKRVVVELTRKFPTRSNQQNKYLHLILSWWGLYYGCTQDYAKRHFFKWECNRDVFLVERTANDGTIYRELKSSADLTTEEMTTAIQRFRDYCSFHGCYIPSPDEHEYLMYVEREISKNQEYL